MKRSWILLHLACAIASLAGAATSIRYARYADQVFTRAAGQIAGMAREISVSMQRIEEKLDHE